MRFIIVVLVIGFVVKINLEQHLYDKRLLEESINTRIEKVEYLNRGGYKCYYDGTYFWQDTFYHGDREEQIFLEGDSVSKAANSLDL